MSAENYWVKKAQSVLVGRTIVAARYLTTSEADRLGWERRSVIFELDNGDLVWPSRDDEGNDAGALFTTNSKADTLPVIR
jgi:hypothetical protein